MAYSVFGRSAALVRRPFENGYATEAARPILDHGLNALGLTRVIADIAPGNLASMRVAEKLGFRFIEDGVYRGYPVKSYAVTRNMLPGVNLAGNRQ